MATPLTLFLSAALVWLGVGLGVLDEDSLALDEDSLALDEDPLALDEDSLDEVDSTVLVLREYKHEIKGQL